MELEITSNNPDAVDKAAASPPAATKAIIQGGKFATSGVERTIISRSILISLVSLSGLSSIRPLLSLSEKAKS